MKTQTFFSIALAVSLFGTAHAQTAKVPEPPRPPGSEAGTSITVTPVLSTAADAKIQPTLRFELTRVDRMIRDEREGKGRGRSVLAVPGHGFGSDMLIRVIISTVDLASTSEHVQRLGGRLDWIVDDIATVRIPLDRLAELAASSDVTAIDGGGESRPSMLDRSRPAIGADRVQSGFGLNRGYTGKGVIVGVIDTGIDEDHRDFQDASGRTRILSLWDVSDNSGTPPQGFDHGSEYTSADIDAGACRQSDGNGHGTHVAGIAAGNGASSGGIHTGIAPEADLIFVHGTRAADGNSGFTHDDVIDGCRYIFQRAAERGRPAVINLSLGGHVGGHDGRSLYERALTAMTGPGRIIVAAAGNEGSEFIHAGGSLTGDAGADIPFAFTASAGGMVIYYDGPGITTTVVARDPNTYAPIAYLTPYVAPGQKIEGALMQASGVLLGRVMIDASVVKDPETGSSIIAVVIDDAGGQSRPDQILWSVFIGGAGRYDAWALMSQFAPTDYGIEGVVAGDHAMTLGMPASANNVIAVASCVTKNQWIDQLGLPREQKNVCSGAGLAQIGGLSCFSSVGPTRDNRNKPEITAPGEAIFSARSGDLAIGAEGGPGVVAESSVPYGFRDYQKLEGTSMAAPHVAGAVALLLERNPLLDYDAIMRVISSSAIHPYPGFAPNTSWGYGILNIWGAMLELDPASAEASTPGAADLVIAPNPASGTTRLHLSLPKPGHVTVDMLDVRGRSVGITIDREMNGGEHELTFDVTTLPPGTYGCRVTTEEGSRIVPLRVAR